MSITLFRSLKDLGRGIIRHPWKTVGYIFTAFSVLFTIIRALTHFFPGVKIEGTLPLIAALAISICYGFRKVWKPSNIEIKIPTTNTTIEVLFGDLFALDGIRAIAVSEFFDSKLGKPVSDKSLHGMFLQKCFGGHPESFDKQVNEQLKGFEGREAPPSSLA